MAAGRALAALALAASVACVTPVAGARTAHESWAPKKANRTCAAKRRSCRRWRMAFTRAAPGPVQEIAPGGSGGGAQPGGLPPAEALGHSLQVRADEYSLTLSRTTVAAGAVAIEFNTVSAEDPHDLQMRDESGGVQTLFGETAPELVPPPRQSFPLAAGDYVLFCSLPGHEALGMHANLAVE